MALRIILLNVVIWLVFPAFAQTSRFDKKYFRSPVAIPIDLSANFGELRTNHWHMGLDIRTRQKENLPIYAAAGGYVAQIGIRPQSFGRFIVLRHPNGLSTLYAHLNDFFPALEAWVTGQQYQQESWAVELQPEAGLFPVNKGQLIAYSGNTGGSMGPHLHFEIFETETGKRLNPLLFDFGIRDNVPPSVSKIAMYDRSRSIHTQSPILYNLKKTDSGYVLSKPGVIASAFREVSFALQAVDRLSGSNNPNGIFSAKLYVDDEPHSGFTIDYLDYDETLYMNAHIDYSYKANGGVYLQQLSRMPGDQGSAYQRYRDSDVITLSDSIHNITIDVRDAHGNSSPIFLQIRYDDSLDQLQPRRETKEQILPASSSLVEKTEFRASIPAGSVYDAVPVHYFRTQGSGAGAVSAIHQLNDHSVPLHRNMTVSIRPDRPVPESLADRLIMHRSGKGNSYKKVNLVNGWASAEFDEFGKFRLLVDDSPPTINSPGKGDTINLRTASRIIFTPKDNFGLVKSFRAELDGRWIRFTNDKSRNWIYRFDERWESGVRELKVVIEDIAGNRTEKSWWIRR